VLRHVSTACPKILTGSRSELRARSISPFSQLFTLHVTPVVHTYLDELQSNLRRRRELAAIEVQSSLPGVWARVCDTPFDVSCAALACVTPIGLSRDSYDRVRGRTLSGTDNILLLPRSR